MKSYSEAIKEVCELEEKLGLFDIWAADYSIWKLVYKKYRYKYIQKLTGIPGLDNNPQLNIKSFIFSTVKSAFQYLWLISSNKTAKTVFYGFPRLERIDGIYIDKFCDPIINQTSVKESYLYIERGRSCIHKLPRCVNKIMWVEFIDNISLILSRPLSIYFKYKYKHEINNLYQSAKEAFSLSHIDKKFIIDRLAFQYIKRLMLKKLLKSLNTQFILGPNINAFVSIVSAAHQLGIKIYELQHGITEGLTPEYSGKYMPELSPDLFLAFGETSMKPVFNVPIERMMNIGFAFKTMLKEYTPIHNKDKYLIVSDPEITESMIEVASILASKFPHKYFTIRFHPLEYPTALQIKKVQDNNVEIDDGKINSFIAIMQNEGIIGEKSSMLYEALSLGVKTAKLHCIGLNKEIDLEEEKSKGFFVANNLDEIGKFLSSNRLNQSIPVYYSDFKPEIINKIICEG